MLLYRPKRFPDLLRPSTRSAPISRARRGNRPLKIAVAVSLVPSACRRRNKLSMEGDVDPAPVDGVRSRWRHKIAAFGNDRGALCKMRSTGKSAHRRECGRRYGGLWWQRWSICDAWNYSQIRLVIVVSPSENASPARSRGISTCFRLHFSNRNSKRCLGFARNDKLPKCSSGLLLRHRQRVGASFTGGEIGRLYDA